MGGISNGFMQALGVCGKVAPLQLINEHGSIS